MRLFIPLNAIFVITMFSYMSMVKAECPRHIAPGNFLNPKVAWNKTDTGVIINGFADLRNSTGSLQRVSHGIDLSQHNRADYKKIIDCGGDFSFVRVDSYFQKHSSQLSNNKITAIPYFFFPIDKNLRYKRNFANMSQGIVDKYNKSFHSIGENAGKKAIQSLKVIGDNFRESNVGGINGRLVALDVEQMLVDFKSSNDIQRANFGRFYAKAVCSWLKTVREVYPDLVLTIYTTPAVYGEYLDKAYKPERDCLQAAPLWIARTTSDGGDALRDTNSTVDRYTQRMCLVDGGNRCLVHQYSHRGIFIATGKPIKGIPPHVDLDRFHSSQLVKTGSGDVYVRN